MNRTAPWFAGVTTSTPDADYFTAAPAGFSLRIRPTLGGDPVPLTGAWCPDGMQLITLATRAGHRVLFWIDVRVTLGDVWTDEEISELLFAEPQSRRTLRRRPGFDNGVAGAIHCPTA